MYAVLGVHAVFFFLNSLRSYMFLALPDCHDAPCREPRRLDSRLQREVRTSGDLSKRHGSLAGSYEASSSLWICVEDSLCSRVSSVCILRFMTMLV